MTVRALARGALNAQTAGLWLVAGLLLHLVVMSSPLHAAAGVPDLPALEQQHAHRPLGAQAPWTVLSPWLDGEHAADCALVLTARPTQPSLAPALGVPCARCLLVQQTALREPSERSGTGVPPPDPQALLQVFRF